MRLKALVIYLTLTLIELYVVVEFLTPAFLSTKKFSFRNFVSKFCLCPSFVELQMESGSMPCFHEKLRLEDTLVEKKVSILMEKRSIPC